MARITLRTLEHAIARLNTLTDSCKFYANGDYILSRAYGGYSLHRVMSASGGVNDVFGTGHMPARDLYLMICAFMDGFNACKEASK